MTTKVFYQKHKADINKVCREYYRKNKEKILALKHCHREEINKKNREEINKKRRENYRKGHPVRRWVHQLTNVDRENKRASCTKCGDIELVCRPNGKIFCPFSHYRIKKLLNFPNKITKNGICPICNKQKRFVIDHCHKTNKFRGFICSTCNQLLGLCYDNPKILNGAIKYLSSN